MIGKAAWAVIFGFGTTAGGGAAFLLPERLWSDAQTVVIYKKGDQEKDNTFLKIGGDKEMNYIIQEAVNSESLIRIGDKELEHQSANYLKTQNNSLWLTGNYRSDSPSWRQGMNKKGKTENGKGALSLYFLNISCDDLMSGNGIRKEEISVNCERKVKD